MGSGKGLLSQDQKIIACFSAKGKDPVRRENSDAEDRRTYQGNAPQIGKRGWDLVKMGLPFPGCSETECVQATG